MKRTHAELLSIVSKPVARQRLKDERDAIIAEPIDNIQVGDIEDREKIQGAVEYFDSVSKDGVKMWIMADNSISYLTKEQMQSLIPAYILRVDKAFNAYAQASVQLEQTIDEDVIKNTSVRSFYDA